MEVRLNVKLLGRTGLGKTERNTGLLCAGLKLRVIVSINTSCANKFATLFVCSVKVVKVRLLNCSTETIQVTADRVLVSPALKTKAAKKITNTINSAFYIKHLTSLWAGIAQ
jgi:hypothetical protein